MNEYNALALALGLLGLLIVIRNVTAPVPHTSTQKLAFFAGCLMLLAACASYWEDEQADPNLSSILLAEQPAEEMPQAAPLRFSNRDEFLAYQARLGYVFLGRFDEHWPAEIVSQDQAMDQISFLRSNGTRHTYPGYTGYQLKVVRLDNATDDDTVIVLRSQDKRP